MILGSHLDKIPKRERKTVIGKVQQMNKDKAYAGLFSVNFFVADIRNKEAVQEIVEKYSQESNYQTMATILWTQNEAPNEKKLSL